MRIALGTLLTCLAVVGCGASTGPSPDGVDAGDTGWERLPDPPLSPRWGPVAAWVAGKAVFVGGETSDPCPPNAGCALPPENARDGAAYDPVSRRWTPIAPAPRPLPALAPRAVVGDLLYVLGADRLMSYDAAHDVWSTVPTPARLDARAMTVDGTRLVLAHGSDEQGEGPDRVLDTATGSWSVLPEDPIGPAFDRAVSSTPAGLVLTAHELVDQPGSGDQPSVVLAALLDREDETWTRLPDSDQLGGGRWTWTGSHLVDPSLGGANGGGGGAGEYGRRVPAGGMLDPVSGTWSRLPDPPADLSGSWPVEALDGPVVAAEGWLFDDRTDTWTRLARPVEAPSQPGSAVWADDLLVVYGGLDHGSGRTAAEAYSTHAWGYLLPD